MDVEVGQSNMDKDTKISRDVLLPDKPSALLRVALKDARALDRDRYHPNSSLWHLPSEVRERCSVCFAGAVIAGSLGALPTVTVDTQDIQDANVDAYNKIRALNAFRTGSWVTALNHLDIDEFQDLNDDQIRLIPNLPTLGVLAGFLGWEDFDAFLSIMEHVAEKFASVNL